MKYPSLGRSGLIVGELCLLPCFLRKQSAPTISVTAEKMIEYYLEQGGNHIDTANI